MVDVASYFLSSWSCMVTMDVFSFQFFLGLNVM